MTTSQQIRTFIAIELPGDLKARLLQLQTELSMNKPMFIKWVAPDSIHLTLKFLGDIFPHQIDKICKAIEEASQGIPSFQLETRELGAFPNLRRPRVFWLGFAGELDKLLVLQHRIEEALIPQGFPREKRSFAPHITLARTRERASDRDLSDFGKLITNSHFKDKYKVNVNSISMMRSQLLPRGAIYTRLYEVTLKDNID